MLKSLEEEIMKSLDIINKQIKNDKHQIEFLLDNGIDKSLLKFKYKAIEELEQIKQDLEVLEILQVLILHNGKSVGYKGIISDFEVMFRLGKITQEQLDRLKQWLEENENGN